MTNNPRKTNNKSTNQSSNNSGEKSARNDGGNALTLIADESASDFRRIDGGEMQRSKRGLGPSANAPGSPSQVGGAPSLSTSQADAVVLSFPTKVRTRVRPPGEEQTLWQGEADDAESSPARASTGATRPRATPRSPKRTQRGPNPIGVLMPTLALPKNLSGYRPQDVGLVTHAAVAILAPYARDYTPFELAEHLLDVTGALVNGKNVNRRRVLMLTAASHVAVYFRRFAPTTDWALLGCEFDTTGGRTDLAWQHTETGRVFFDELKTHNRSVAALSSQTVAQAKRQGEGGVRQFGDLFAGVRVLPFGALHLVTLVHPDHIRVPLSATPSDPLRTTTDATTATAAATGGAR